MKNFGKCWVVLATGLNFIVGTVNAQSCSVNAAYSGSKAVQGSKYVFTFDVTSSTCAATTCMGVLHTTTSYRVTGGASGSDSMLVHFVIPAGQTKAHIIVQHSLGTDPNAAIANVDGVTIDSAECKVQ